MVSLALARDYCSWCGALSAPATCAACGGEYRRCRCADERHYCLPCWQKRFFAASRARLDVVQSVGYANEAPESASPAARVVRGARRLMIVESK